MCHGAAWASDLVSGIRAYCGGGIDAGDKQVLATACAPWGNGPWSARPRRGAQSLVVLLTALALSACDETFMPIEPSDLQFSIFGYLDASADTQWVRVMPIRPLQVTTPGPLAATVTLEHLGTGRVVELRDSVFRYAPNPDVGSDGIYLHNFWTTEPIEPGATYRFAATLDGSAPSEAVVEIAPEYDVEIWDAQGGGSSAVDFLWIDGLDHVAHSKITEFYDDCGAAVEEELLSSTSRDSEGPLRIPLRAQPHPRHGCGSPEIERRELLVIGSGAPWPSGEEHSTGALGVPDAPSDISNSVGFLGGVLTRRVPYEACQIVNGPPQPYCRLRYDEFSVTLRGTVRDAYCGGEVARATVRLREVHADPRASRKVRSTKSSRSGSFEIGALVGGQRYAMDVYRMSGGVYDYQTFVDTLTFRVGEQRTIEVGLRSVDPCFP